MSFLKKQIVETVLPKLEKELQIKNPMQLPRIEKIVVNMGIGSLVTGGMKDFSSLKNDLTLITGQSPITSIAKKAISNFKLKIGQPVGMVVTLRGERMYYFLEKLIHIVLPRVRDFRGLSAKSFDKEGNYNFGIREHTIFPEVPQTDVVKPRGFQVTIKFKSRGIDDSRAFLKEIGFPFSK